MGVINKEKKLVSELTGVNEEKIRFSDDGFLSRGYVIDNGRIVFKFKRKPSVNYESEVRNLEFINSLNLNINVQKVGWESKKDKYLGLYGVEGSSLETVALDSEKCKIYGKQLGLFLKELHNAQLLNAERVGINAEILAWQKRYKKSRRLLSNYFNKNEIAKMDQFVMFDMPKTLYRLGEKIVFSHGDLGMGNVFIDKNEKVGVIDFSESSYLDEAADFMDIESDDLCKEMLNYYGADGILEEKVGIRRIVRPMFVIGTYKDRSEKEKQKLVKRIRKWLSA